MGLYYFGNRSASVRVLATAANATIVVAGNSTVSNITSNSSQVLTGATISRIDAGVGTSGYFNIKRGSNLVWSGQNGSWLFDGRAIDADKTANLVIEIIGTANGSVLVELHKEGTGTGTP